jgi:hypothetical protein
MAFVLAAHEHSAAVCHNGELYSWQGWIPLFKRIFFWPKKITKRCGPDGTNLTPPSCSPRRAHGRRRQLTTVGGVVRRVTNQVTPPASECNPTPRGRCSDSDDDDDFDMDDNPNDAGNGTAADGSTGSLKKPGFNRLGHGDDVEDKDVPTRVRGALADKRVVGVSGWGAVCTSCMHACS